MTSSWHPAAITVPVAAAALVAATSWAVAAASTDPMPAPPDTQQVKVHRIERAIHQDQKDIRQLHRAIDRARDHIHRQEKVIAVQRAANAASSTWSASTSSAGSSAGSAPAPAAPAPAPKPAQANPAPNPPPNTSTGGS